MAYSLHLICTTPDDYSCNEVIIIAETPSMIIKSSRQSIINIKLNFLVSWIKNKISQ